MLHSNFFNRRSQYIEITKRGVPINGGVGAYFFQNQEEGGGLLLGTLQYMNNVRNVMHRNAERIEFGFLVTTSASSQRINNATRYIVYE